MKYQNFYMRKETIAILTYKILLIEISILLKKQKTCQNLQRLAMNIFIIKL
jgi:hypothetical protein